MNYKEMLLERCDVKEYIQNNVLIVCPFHSDNNPSLSVHVKTGGFQCWSCGETGNFTKLIAALDNITIEQAKENLQQDFSAAVVASQIERQIQDLFEDEVQRKRYLDDKVVFCIFPEVSQLSRKYLHSRGIYDKTIDLFDLRQGVEYLRKGTSIKKWVNRIIFPFYDLENRMVGFGGRSIIKGVKPKVKKYVVYEGAGKTFLYGLSNLWRGKKLDYLILGESDIDTLYLQQFGLNAVAAWAVGKLSEQQIYLILRTTKLLILNYNNRYIDEAGKKATERGLVQMKQYLPTVVCDFPKGRKDANELTVKEVKDVYFSLLRRCKINVRRRTV